jgi:hypothetical protein
MGKGSERGVKIELARVGSSLFSVVLQVPRFLALRHVYYRATIYFGLSFQPIQGSEADGVSWCLSWLQRDPSEDSEPLGLNPQIFV